MSAHSERVSGETNLAQQSALLKSGADFYVKLGILGVTNPKRYAQGRES